VFSIASILVSPPFLGFTGWNLVLDVTYATGFNPDAPVITLLWADRPVRAVSTPMSADLAPPVGSPR
jgi:hypothetical protein